MNAQQAEARGAECFQNGIPRAPLADPDFNPTAPNAIALARSWLKGWDKANLDNPLNDLNGPVF